GLSRMDHVANHAPALGLILHHPPQFWSEVVKARVHAGEGYFTDWALAVAILVDFEAPGTRFELTAAHQFMDNVMRVSERASQVGELNAGRVLHVAAAVAHPESVDRHRLPLIVSIVGRMLIGR